MTQFDMDLERLDAVVATVRDTAAQWQHNPDRISIVAVSKTVAPERIEQLLIAGHRCFGESKVQEAQDKWPRLKARFPDAQLRLIGALQTNKVRAAVALFDAIDTVDREKLARKLAAEMAEQARALPCLIQLNTGAEPQKAGIAPVALPDFLALCRDDLGLPVDGLMCLPPAGEEPAPHFALMARLAARHGLTTLSMGMSGDYRLAVQFGATMVRPGAAIFGERVRAKDPAAHI